MNNPSSAVKARRKPDDKAEMPAACAVAPSMARTPPGLTALRSPAACGKPVAVSRSV